MYETLITKIRTTLEGISAIKVVLSTPTSKLTKFPAVFFKPTGFTNAYETQNENANVYQFMLIILVGSEATTIENAFGTVLPRTVDAIKAAFDSEWDYGTIEGHRVRTVITGDGPWDIDEQQDGLIAYAPLRLEISLLTNN